MKSGVNYAGACYVRKVGGLFKNSKCADRRRNRPARLAYRSRQAQADRAGRSVRGGALDRGTQPAPSQHLHRDDADSAATAERFGGIGRVAGGALGVRNPNDLYVGMLRSRTVADSLIARFELAKVYEQALQSGTRLALQGNTSIVSGRDGIITVEVDDKDPKRAADIANAYVDELMKLSKVLAVTEASQRRLFFERQLEQAKDSLTTAEIAARQGLQKGGLAQVDAQGRSMIAVTARLRAEISVKEVQLGAMRTFAAEGNPELQRTQQELEALRRELSRVEGSSSVAAIGRGDAPGNRGLDNLGLLRDVKYYEFLYELLAKQYELAKIDEAKDATVVQVMDRAIEPDRKSKPR